MKYNYQNIIFDLDSTLTKIEGIDYLAQLKGVADQIEPLTAQAMAGEIPLNQVFRKRLEIVQPNRQDIITLADAYIREVVPDAREVMTRLRQSNYQIFVITGGFRQAVLPLTDYLGINSHRVFANELFFDNQGNYLDFDRRIPLWQDNGKIQIYEQIKGAYLGNWFVVGDGVGDLQLGKAAGQFFHFTGVITRSNMTGESHPACQSFAKLEEYLLDQP